MYFLRACAVLGCANRCSGVSPKIGSPLGPVYGSPIPTPPPPPAAATPPGPRRPSGCPPPSTGGAGSGATGGTPTLVAIRDWLSSLCARSRCLLPCDGVAREGLVGATPSASSI